MLYIIKHSNSKNAKYNKEEKVKRFIEKELDIYVQLWEHKDSLKAVRKED